METTRGIIESAQKVVIYGPEGIGKSSLAAMFPKPIFIDTEGSTKKLDVERLPKPSSWTMILEQVKYIKSNPYKCDTLVLDTADWAERLSKEEICAKSNKDSIEAFGYGKGYTYLSEDVGRLLNLLEELIELNINVVLVAHAQMRKFDLPDEMGSYDRWELKMEKKVYPLVKEWADMILFVNYKTFVVNVDGQGAAKGKNKAQGGERVMFTSHHPCWDAKNRHGLAPELKLSYGEIKHCIPDRKKLSSAAPPPEPPKEQTKTEPPKTEPKEPPKEATKEQEAYKPVEPPAGVEIPSSIPKALTDLMRQNNVTVEEIQAVVGSKGYYPSDTPIENYDPKFISGVLVGAWPQVLKMIKAFQDEDAPY